MEKQSKKVYDRAIEMYRVEISRVMFNTTFNDLDSFKKVQRQIERKIDSLLQAEIKTYSRLPELSEKLFVLLL